MASSTREETVPRPRSKPHSARGKIEKRTLRRAYYTLLASQLTISSGGIMARFALQDMGPIAVAAWRLNLAAVALLLRFVIMRRPRLLWRHELYMVGAGILLAEQFATWTLSLSYLTVGNAMLLVCTAPFWNGLYEAFILRHPVKRSFWLALAAAVGGIALMVQDNNAPSLDADGSTGLGVILAVSSGLGMAIYFVLMRHMSNTSKSYGTLDLLTRAYVYASLILMTASAFESQPLPPLSHWRPWLSVAGMAIITQGVGHTLQNRSLRHLRASIVGFSTLLEPIIAAGLAALIFKESLGWVGFAGGALVIGALAWALKVMDASGSEAPQS